MADKLTDEEMCELIDVGFKGIFQGDNLRTLDEKLLFFIEKADRKAVSYFENS